MARTSLPHPCIGLATAVLLAVCGLLSGCSYVTVSQPLGTDAVLLDPAEIDGAWYAEHDDPFLARYVGPGQVRVAAVVWRDGAFALEQALLHVRSDGNHIYVSIDAGLEAGQDLEGYIFTRVKIEPGRWIAWAPVAAAFRKAVDEGTLSGVRYGNDPDDDDVHITSSRAELSRFINADREEAVWDTDNVLIYTRFRGETTD